MSEEMEKLRREMKRSFVMLELRMTNLIEELRKEQHEDTKKRDSV